MAQSMVTVAAPIATDKIPQALALIAALGNPASPAIAGALSRLDGDDGVHFASLHAIAPTDIDSATGHLVLEFSADGTASQSLARVVDRIGPELEPIFALAADRGGGALLAYVSARTLELGCGWTGRTGLAFAGTPGMSVGRIGRERDLAAFITPVLENQTGGMSALKRLSDVRDKVRANPDLAWALQTPSPLPVAPAATTAGLVAGLLGAFAATYLWPLLIPFFLVLGFGLERNWGAFMALFAASAAAPLKVWMIVKALWAALLWALAVACAFAVPVLAFAAWLYVSLRAKEASDWLDERAPQRKVLHEILARENILDQNHMVSVTMRKPGLTRRITTRLAFWLIGQLAVRQFKPGHLGDIGTIHFARWVMLPGSRDFVFFSNYGGSWESYLEDFITKAHNGLTAVWSNTVGFPKSENLFGKGATDGERFKRYARRSMLATPFWHNAYPTLTTDNIRSNAAIRCGLAAAMTDEEAKAWLALFGSAQRPAVKLESDQIQSLVFGGLGFKPHGEALLVDFKDDRAAVRAWLGALRAHVAWDDGRRLQSDAVVTLALGPGALAKAGLPADALETFPPAFLDGMTGPGRARILGDDQGAGDWWWGAERSPDVAVLVYGERPEAAQALADEVRRLVAAHGHTIGHAIPLNPVPVNPHEPFGFLDGVSQPVIRGTYRGLRNPDPIHLVEPGEFILGYPDNRGNLPPGPTLKALDDPDNRLPIALGAVVDFAAPEADAPREVARNGSFLVIRQLEQDHDAFWAYCDAEAKRLQNRLPAPYNITADFIGAKLVGRWPNGSSLVRNPYQPFGLHGLESHDTQRPESHPVVHAAAVRAPLAHAPSPIAPAAVAAAPPVTAVFKSAADAHAAAATPAKAAKAVKLPDHGDNDFLFGAEDPQGLRCPYGAHIRRANPRDSLSPGSQDQVDISNRHRIIRVGRSYVPQDGQKPGLLFMCLNGDLERQFEFVQQTWLGSETFHSLAGERDPLAGNTGGCPIGFTVPTRDGPVRLSPLARFVTPRGGGYFFLPGKALLEYLTD